MSDYFTKVTAKALGSAPVVRPRLVSWFGPPTQNPAVNSGDFDEVVTEADPSPASMDRVAGVDRTGHKSRSEPSPDARTPPVHSVDTLHQDMGSDQTVSPPVRGAARIEVETRPEPPVVHLPLPASPKSVFSKFTIIPGPDNQVADSAFDISCPDGDPKPPVQNGAIGRPQARGVAAHVPPAKRLPEPRGEGRVSVAMAKTGLKANVESPNRENLSADAAFQGVQPARHNRFRFPPLPVSAVREPEPTIQVTIGRLEVRATPLRQPTRGEAQKRESANELEQYLRRRTGGARE